MIVNYGRIKMRNIVDQYCYDTLKTWLHLQHIICYGYRFSEKQKGLSFSSEKFLNLKQNHI
jgi:hypothetical protein